MNQVRNILLTGSTGILGSNILYELLNKYASGEWKGKLALLIRPSKYQSQKIEKRVQKILSKEFIPDYLKNYNYEDLLSHVFVIKECVGKFSADQLPKGLDNVTVIHAAGSVNLGNDNHAYSDVVRNNLDGSMNLLREILPIASKVCFVSTAYSSGHRNGLINDSYLDFCDCKFRNPYEKFKNRIEQEVVKKCEAGGIDWQIVRPGIICGRLIDSPLFLIPRFTVFYMIGKFVYLIRRGSFGEPNLNIYAPKESGLNIIPVDYVAKSIVRGLFLDEKEINVVHSRNVDSHLLFQKGFDTMGYRNYNLLDQLPGKLSVVEKLYHKTINNQLLPYIETPIHQFDSTKVRGIMKDIPEPDVSDNFSELVQFAVDHRFKNLF